MERGPWKGPRVRLRREQWGQQARRMEAEGWAWENPAESGGQEEPRGSSHRKRPGKAGAERGA